jgi:hypothetical protein
MMDAVTVWGSYIAKNTCNLFREKLNMYTVLTFPVFNEMKYHLKVHAQKDVEIQEVWCTS